MPYDLEQAISNAFDAIPDRHLPGLADGETGVYWEELVKAAAQAALAYYEMPKEASLGAVGFVLGDLLVLKAYVHDIQKLHPSARRGLTQIIEGAAKHLGKEV